VPAQCASIFIYGGSILPGNFRGQVVTVQDMFEAVGRHSVGSLSDEDLDEMEQVACPSAGACGAQFTATPWRPFPRRSASRCPIRRGACPLRDPRQVLHGGGRAGHGTDPHESASARHRDPQGAGKCRRVVAASGGSTNAALHLPAIAHECGIEFTLFDVAEVFKKTPYVADLKPGGRYVAKTCSRLAGYRF